MARGKEMVITTDVWLYLLIGFGAGFLIELLLDFLFWRPRSKKLAAEVDKQGRKINRLENNLNERTQEAVRAKTAWTKWEAQARNWKAQLADIKLTLERSQTTGQRMEFDSQNLQHRLQNAIGRAGQLEQRLHNHIEQNGRLSAQLTHTEETITDLESKMHVPEEVWDTLNGRISHLKAELTTVLAERAQLQQELTAAVAEMSELQSKMHVPEETWDALNQKIRTLESQLTAEQEKVAQQAQTVTDLHDQQQTAATHNERLERRLRIAQVQIAELVTQLEQLESLTGQEVKKTIQG